MLRNKCFLELTRTHCPRNTSKNPVNTGRHDIFPKFILRGTLENRRFLEFTSVCSQGKWKKSRRKLLKTKEHTIISVRLPNGERWKTRVFLNSLEFAVSVNKRKQEKTPVNARIHFAFLTLTERWIVENSLFCEIYHRLALWKTRENAGFQSLTPDEREVLHPKNICERKQTRHSPSVNRPVNSNKRAFSAIPLNGKLPVNGTNTLIPRRQNSWKILDFPIGEHQRIISKCHTLRKFTARFLNGERHLFCRAC